MVAFRVRSLPRLREPEPGNRTSVAESLSRESSQR